MTAGDVSLSTVVAMRREGQHVDEEAALALLCSEVAGRDGTTDGHEVRWAAEAWLRQGVRSSGAWDASEAIPTGGQADDRSVWSASAYGALTRLASSLRTVNRFGTRLISRADVFERREGDPLDLFLAVMAWGYGDRGYGWRRTANVIAAAERDGGVSRLADVVRTLRDCGTGAPHALFRMWSRGGDAKLRGLGTAFASKLAYFVSYDRDRGTGPLIADNNTGWSIWALANIARSTSVAEAYADYVEQAEDWARHLGCRSDDVELALFRLGPRVREAYRFWGDLAEAPRDG